METQETVTVFGSTVIRVEPDVALLNFAVTSLQSHPQQAFQETRDRTKIVREYLTQARVNDVSTSRMSLKQEFRFVSGEQRFVGYQAEIAFQVLLLDLDRVEEILTTVVDKGVNKINSVEFQTSRLKEVRAEARRRAVGAAQEKAQIYCEAAGAHLGAVFSIKDENPEMLRGREGHVIREIEIDDEDRLQAFDPGSIVIAAAVTIAFQIEPESR